MAYSILQIKDIFIGSIDAKDDVNNSISQVEFIENFIMPPNFEISEFLEGSKCFIEGYKGTGKTALLNYISKCEEQKGSIGYFMLFKSDYKNIDRNKLSILANNIIEFDNESLTEETDFEYIWRWIILNKIVQLNIKNDYKLFKKDKEWDKFEKIINSLSYEKESKSIFNLLPFNVKKIGELGYSVKLNDSDIIHSLGLKDVELERKEIDFPKLLMKSLDLFSKLTIADINAYIFIDELEAFYEDSNIFKRDLRMIRDLILTVKYFNDLFIQIGYPKLKIICAVRTEVLESIKKYISTKEINKVTYSFRRELKWNYSNTNAYQHPIIQIWLKRIKIAESKNNNLTLTDSEVMDKWFTKKVNSDEIVPYILDNSWHKPRDIVRFLQSASNVSPNSTKYDQNVFNKLRKEYSKESWKEIFEELNILYSPEEIEYIRDFLMCYKRYFTFQDAKVRAKAIAEQSGSDFIVNNLGKILKDLYRVGCIGNMSIDKRYYRWQHKGDDSLIIDDEKLYIIIHSGLWSELSLFYVYKEESNKEEIEIGDEVKCKVDRIKKSFAYVSILNSNLEGSIHISKISYENKFAKNINRLVKVGDIINAKVIGIDNKYGLQLERIK